MPFRDRQRTGVDFDLDFDLDLVASKKTNCVTPENVIFEMLKEFGLKSVSNFSADRNYSRCRFWGLSQIGLELFSGNS